MREALVIVSGGERHNLHRQNPHNKCYKWMHSGITDWARWSIDSRNANQSRLMPFRSVRMTSDVIATREVKRATHDIFFDINWHVV